MKIRLVDQGYFTSETGFFRTMFPEELSKFLLKDLYKYSYRGDRIICIVEEYEKILK